MNKLAVMIFSLAIGVFGPAASQAPVERIAYESCYFYIDYQWGILHYYCDVVVANVDGTGAATLPAAVDPAWSPDGSRIAYSDVGGSGLYVWNPTDGTITTLDYDPTYYGSWGPTWAPDGQQIAFHHSRTGSSELYAWHADGSITQLTNLGRVLGGPAWSPDGTRIAYDCLIDQGNIDVCMLELATGAITRLTTDPGTDMGPAWSPDGTRLAFATERFGGSSEIALMNPDGTGASRIGSGVQGFAPTWSPSGNRLAYETGYWECYEYEICGNFIHLVNVDGTGQTFFGYGFDTAWAASSAIFGRPNARISFSCADLTCYFDGLSSWDSGGQISGYAWGFGDGGSGTGDVIYHTFPAAGTYSVTLTVVDNDGLEGSMTTSVTVAAAPRVVLTVSCTNLTCTFDSSGSFDPDGTIVAFLWVFGDSTQATGAIVTHTYPSAHDYFGTLVVTDNSGAITMANFWARVTGPLHVGDLDGSATSLRDKWTAGATITVHNDNHQPMANVMVTGSWSDGTSGICVTNGVGQCTLFSAQLKNSTASVTFTVSNLSLQSSVYTPAANHDPDGDSSGTSITVRKR